MTEIGFLWSSALGLNCGLEFTLPETAEFSGISEEWTYSADVLPARSPLSTQISVSIKHLELSQVCLEWANVSKIHKVRSIRTV